MLLNRQTLDGIARGEITLAFRRWRRPTVRSGGTMLTAAGQLVIRSVSRVEAGDITADAAALAGYVSREALLAELDRHAAGDCYRIEFGALLADPRVALRGTPPGAREMQELQRQLDQLDRDSVDGPWALRTLRAIRDHPELRAGDLCRLVGQKRDRFKPNVRKLKALGLTISLEVGYRLSVRGEACLQAIEASANEQ